MKHLVNGESGYMQAWGKKTSLWISAKLKPAVFRANTLHNRLFSEPTTVYRRKHVVSRHFHRIYLKANKVSKSEDSRKVKYAYHFWKCADDVHRKLSKLVHACRSYNLPKLARFLRHSVVDVQLLWLTSCIIYAVFWDADNETVCSRPTWNDLQRSLKVIAGSSGLSIRHRKRKIVQGYWRWHDAAFTFYLWSVVTMSIWYRFWDIQRRVMACL